MPDESPPIPRRTVSALTRNQTPFHLDSRHELKSIKSKILTFALLATFIPSMGLGLLSFWRYQAVINDDVSHELRTLAKDTSGDLTIWLRERVNDVRALSTSYVLIDGLTPGTVSQPGRATIGAREL